jgi:hypothetical protein
MLEKIWKSEYSLKEFTDPKNFKSYDELKRKLNDVLGISGMDVSRVDVKVNETVTKTYTKSDEPSFEASKPRKSVEDTPPWTDSEDEDLDYFKSLAD